MASALLYYNSAASEHAVHTLDSFAAVVDALRPDALAAGVVKPPVFGSSHGLARDLALMY